MKDLRISRLRNVMEQKKTDAFVTFSCYDITYFTGTAGIEGALVVLHDTVRLFVSKLYRELAETTVGAEHVTVTGEALKDIVEWLSSKDVHSVAFDYLTTPAQYAKDLSGFMVVDFTNQTKLLRMIKEREEINSIKRAAFIARNAFMKVYPQLRVGVTEKEIADELSYQIRKASAQRESFDIIVAAGENASHPHHIPTDRKIGEGEFVVIDFGAHVDGYNSDMTYTFLMDPKDDEKKELYNAVFYAQLFATEMIAPGRTRIKQIEERAREELKKRGLEDYFIHSLGHGVGLEVHEFPVVNLKNDMVVQPGMIFTIEPGIYIPGKLGIRLEHMVLVKENDTEVLAFAPFMEAM